MKILFLYTLLPLVLFSQENFEPCEQEMEKKCDPNVSTHSCIVEQMGKKKNFFSKKCARLILKKLSEGAYADPCLVEKKRLCGNDVSGECIKRQRNRLTEECQEKISDQGDYKLEKAEDLTKIFSACEKFLMVECGPLRIDMEMAFRKGQMSQGEKWAKQYEKCTKKVMANTGDEKCQKALLEHSRSQKKSR
jgi:hypothetical protein